MGHVSVEWGGRSEPISPRLGQWIKSNHVENMLILAVDIDDHEYRHGNKETVQNLDENVRKICGLAVRIL